MRKSDKPAALLELDATLETALDALLELIELDTCDEATLETLLELDAIVVKLMA